jgi:SNF2 family DNA or RNA helicase
MKDGKQVTFRLSLIITPVNSLPQTYLEAKEIFPDFNLVVFYGTRSTFIDKGAKVIGLDELITYLKNLDLHNPKTGKTLVITSYTTLSARFIQRNERLFKFKEDKVPPSLQKKKDRNQKKQAERHDEDSSQSDNDNDEDDLLNIRRRKIQVYHIDQIKLSDIIVVTDPKLANGNLVWYTRRPPGIKEIEFQFVVCNKAQVTKKADGSYNHLLRKFKWNVLLWTSGTPLSNSLRDLISPLILI